VTATVTAVLVDLPDVAVIIERAAGALGVWAYVVVAGLVFLETVAIVGLLAPGEAMLAVGGAAAAHGELVLLPLILGCGSPASSETRRAIGWAAATDAGSYSIVARCSASTPTGSARLRGCSVAGAGWRSSAVASSASCVRSPPSWPACRACR
jgi:hypothetical protein